ncbi:tetratricopeptide (TPR) repeat protein [Arthrobacter sp. 2762]
MAEHNGGNRDGNRGNFGGNRGDRGSFRPNNNSGGDPRGFRSRENRDGNEQGRSFSGDRDRKPFGDRGDRADRPARDGERRPFNNDRGERKPFGDRPPRDGERRSFGGDRDRKPFGDRGDRADRPARDGERRPFNNDRGERKPFGDRPPRDGERRSFGGDRDRKPFGDRGDRADRPARDGERRPFNNDRGERKPFGDRPERGGERRPFGNDRGERKPFGSRPERGPRNFDGPRRDGEERRPFSNDRGERKPFGDRPERGGERRPFNNDRANSWEERPARVPNAKDIRSANRPDRERSPEIDEDVTGKELDRATGHQIKTLEEQSAGWVAKHLVMAGRLIDIEPELAFQHALAASRRGGRLSAVREAVGLTAYAAGHYGEALREFRTYRRISGSNVHLPVMADCERGLGRPDRALDMVRSPEAQDLDAPGKVELAIVASGARADLNQLDAAVAELEIPQLDINRAFSYSPRLFRAYAEALTAVGRTEEADKWARQALVAENALGVGDFAEPEILDLGWDEQEEAAAARKPRFEKRGEDSDVVRPESESVIAEAAAADAEHDDVDIDDAESDYFESDDAESDIDSAEEADEAEAEEAETEADESVSHTEPTEEQGTDSQHG